jgi:DNA-binding transcriptional LysR family regulator
MSAPMLFGELFVTPLLVDYLDQYPQVQAKVPLVDRVVNMAEEDIDMAIRIGDLPENNLHRVKIGTMCLLGVNVCLN